MKKITLIAALFLIFFSCNENKDKKEEVFQARLVTPSSGLKFKDTVNGYEVNWYIRDTVVTVNVPYTYSKTLVDSTMRWLGSVTPPPPPDTTTTPPSSVILYEGFGALATGGPSGTVKHVKTKTDFDNAVGSNRIIIFDNDLTINASYNFSKITYMTIDGNGYNIVFNGNAGNGQSGDVLSFDGSACHHNILKGVTTTNAGGDGINVIDGAHDIMITNCFSFGNRDGNIDIAADNSGQTKNVSVQWCIMGGGAPNSADFSGCNLVTSQSTTIHHNLYVPAAQGDVGERCPLVHCNYSPIGSPNADIRNNVVYNFGRNNATGSGFGVNVGYSATANVVNNWFYSKSDGGNAIVTDGSYGGGGGGSAYVSGNISGNSGVNPNKANNHIEYSIPQQYRVVMQTTCQASLLVLQKAGPRLKNGSLPAAAQSLVSQVTLTNCN